MFQNPIIQDFIAADIQHAGVDANMTKHAFLGKALMVGGLAGLLYAGGKGLSSMIKHRQQDIPGLKWRQQRRRTLLHGHQGAGRPPTPTADPTLSLRRA